MCFYVSLCRPSGVTKAVWEVAAICPAPCKLTFDLLTSKVVFESCVTWATSVPTLVFIGLSVLDLGRPDVRDRRTSDRQTSDMHHSFNLRASALWGRGHKIAQPHPTFLAPGLTPPFRAWPFAKKILYPPLAPW